MRPPRQRPTESYSLQLEGFSTTPAAQWASIQGTPEVYVGLCEREKSAGRAVAKIRAKTLRAERLLARFAKHHPVYKARLTIVRGQIAALEGRNDKAAQLLRSCAEVASRLQLRFDEALAYFEIARLSAAGSAERDRDLAIARAIFTECAAQHELDRVAALER